MYKTCKKCKTLFELQYPNQKFCAVCKTVKKPIFELICPTCLNTFKKSSNNQKYCSYKCRVNSKEYREAKKESWHYMKDIYRPKKPKLFIQCKDCGKLIEKVNSRHIRCKQCRAKKAQKENHKKRVLLALRMQELYGHNKGKRWTKKETEEFFKIKDTNPDITIEELCHKFKRTFYSIRNKVSEYTGTKALRRINKKGKMLSKEEFIKTNFG